jgi:hypothetical protein
MDMSDKTVGEFYLLSSNKGQKFYRKYIKITDILAAVGGLIKSFMIIINVINYPNSSRNYFLTLGNTLFNYDIEEVEENIKIKIHEPSRITLNNLNEINTQTDNKTNINIEDNKLFVMKPIFNNRLTSDEITKLKQRLTNTNIKRKELKFSKKEALILSYCFGRSNSSKFQKKLKVYQKTEKKIFQYSDLTNIMKLSLDMKKLKKIIFNTNQIKYLFDNIENTISSEEIKGIEKLKEEVNTGKYIEEVFTQYTNDNNYINESKSYEILLNKKMIQMLVGENK